MPADQAKPFIPKRVPRPPAIELPKHIQLIFGRKFNGVLRSDNSADDMKRSADRQSETDRLEDRSNPYASLASERGLKRHPAAFSRRDDSRYNSVPDYRARTTSFFVQLWTCRQWGQLILLFVSRVDLNRLSSTVCPVAVSLPVPGHRTNMRLMIRAFGSFRGVLIIKYEFIIFELAEPINDTRFFDVVRRHL